MLSFFGPAPEYVCALPNTAIFHGRRIKFHEIAFKTELAGEFLPNQVGEAGIADMMGDFECFFVHRVRAAIGCHLRLDAGSFFLSAFVDGVGGGKSSGV